MSEAPDTDDESKLWIFAFIILLIVSLWILGMRLLNYAFLALDFEVAIIYLPTVLAGLIVLVTSTRAKPNR